MYSKAIISIYIYIYRERERDRDICVYIYIYIRLGRRLVCGGAPLPRRWLGQRPLPASEAAGILYIYIYIYIYIS